MRLRPSRRQPPRRATGRRIPGASAGRNAEERADKRVSRPRRWVRTHRAAGCRREICALMARVVVIATSELERESLDAVLEPEDELHVVVPAVEQSRLQWLANDEGDARAGAGRGGGENG